MTKIGNKSVLIEQKVVLKGTDTLIVDAGVTFVVTDQKAKKAVVIEGELLELMQQWLAAAN